MGAGLGTEEDSAGFALESLIYPVRRKTLLFWGGDRRRSPSGESFSLQCHTRVVS